MTAEHVNPVQNCSVAFLPSSPIISKFDSAWLLSPRSFSLQPINGGPMWTNVKMICRESLRIDRGSAAEWLHLRLLPTGQLILLSIGRACAGSCKKTLFALNGFAQEEDRVQCSGITVSLPDNPYTPQGLDYQYDLTATTGTQRRSVRTVSRETEESTTGATETAPGTRSSTVVTVSRRFVFVL